MMENTEVKHPWEQQQDDDEDELEEGLIVRKKNLNSTTINGNNLNVGSLNGEKIENHHHHYQQQQQEDDDEEEEEEEKVKEFVQKKVDDEDEKEKQEISDYCVYYDTDKGIDVAAKTNITVNNKENGNGVHSETTKQNGEHQKHEMSYINIKAEASDIEVVKDGDGDGNDEIAEYDVETVIRKQDTHDLFCPNCNSCITKRVILRKRKRRIPLPGEDAKRSRPVSTGPTAVLDDSSDNRALNGVDARLDDEQPPMSNEYDHQREPDVFRCLSCFSIFMPTGNGFKLFRVFGNKDNEQSQNEVPVKKNWFSNFMRSGKVEHNVTDLNGLAEINSAGVSSNLNSSIQEANSHTSNGTTDLEKNQLIRESNGKIAPLANTEEQLLTSYHIEKEHNGKSEHPGMFVVKPPINNNAEDSVSPHEYDGLKLLIPPNVGSLIIDSSQMNQELDVTVSPGLDEKGRTNLSFSPPASIPGQANLGGQVDRPRLAVNLAIDGKEEKMDKDSVAVQSANEVSLQNNVEIHLEEPNKDVVNVLEGVKNIERSEGKDVIITIESKQVDASVFQRPSSDTHGATGSSALQQAVTTTGKSLDVIKSIVYGGLIEVITSLSVVSSAAGSNASTLNVLALGLANIFGGLLVISHDLWNLKNERARKTEDRYQQLLGQRTDFPLHVAVSLLSYLVFGFLPPIVYGFSFRESNDKDLKLLMVAAASIVCIIILASGKAYVQVQRTSKSYFKTIGYHVMLGIMVSGVTYLFGGLIIKLLEKMDVFHESSGSTIHEPALAMF
ncbi:hypothetical protein QVD17_15640 [Tagetes erecta]|uniref:Membrane protein of ER body-like protein n=1 Tax=Tagetes erecta TaxID=13708 RepID=A0AAD8KQ68_TARER|nr:hypothetical protein QVD17_15640 [Tagetes erecta]